jgi:TetR/AcrR family transcriptional regulator, transcriptional repressor for nem operon
MSKAARTRAHILAKAAPVFNRQGVAGTSLSDLMAATGLAKGGIYGNFKSKEELSLQAFHHAMALVSAKLKEATAPYSSCMGKLTAILQFYRHYPTLPPVEGGCPIISFGTEADDTHPAMREAAAQALQQLTSSLERLLAKGIAQGELASSLNPAIFALRTVATIEGGMLLCQVYKSAAPMSPLIDGLMADLMIHVLPSPPGSLTPTL